MRYGTLGIVAVGLFVSVGCGEEPMTAPEVRTAMEESFSAERGVAPTTEPIEISTNFTIGGAVQDAAQELRDWIQTQIPCSTVTVADHTVTVDFGTLDDVCTYNGHTYAGVASISIDKNDAAEVIVTHTWTGLTNGVVTVDGGATVTWSAADHSRHVVHELDWTDGERSAHVSGDRLQTLIDPEQGIEGGIRVEGERAWTVDAGTYDLDIQAVEIRGQDPVPQAGAYVLTNPAGKTLTLTFARVDDDTIQVTAATGRWERVYLVSSDGEAVEES